VSQLRLFEPPRFPDDCLDCGRDTFVLCEYYMVSDELWDSVVFGRGLLCIGCLEARLGHRLDPADFIDCPCNRWPGSRRLESRRRGAGDHREAA